MPNWIKITLAAAIGAALLWGGTAVIGSFDFAQISTPDAPASGRTRLYAKSDGLYYRPAGGDETPIGGDGGKPIYTFSAITSNTNADAFSVYLINDSALTLTLPSAPAVGDQIVVLTTTHTNGTVSRNGKLIMGQTENLVMDMPNASAVLVFTGDTFGWRLL